MHGNTRTEKLDLAVEAALVKAFVVPARQNRVGELLRSERRRRRILSDLPHFRHWDRRFLKAIPPALQSPASIWRLLRDLGAPSDCYLISVDGELDATRRDLRQALETVVAQAGGTVISCIPGSLAYYEGESPNDRGVLHRPSK